ncbi:MAG: hypothetical protein BKP49_01385 [Treponema sp. CETP13]|nr:MAG: hypothetical protein BKP49_01385 [Treponema sp. CETP13]
MSNWYYLMAQLPSFSIEQSAKIPVTQEYVTELCSRFLDKKTFFTLKNISLEPPVEITKTGSALLDAWYSKERYLRLALAQIRALKMKKQFKVPVLSFPPDILQVARTATGFENPLEAEMYLVKARIKALESLRPLEEFSSDALFAYVLKLKLTLRLNKFNAEKGKDSYHRIYSKILAQSTGDNT